MTGGADAACVEVVITGPDAEWAADLARLLVEERWAACVHVLERIRSVYRWQGQIENGSEARLALHTRRDLVEGITTRVAELHPDDVPCVIALPLVTGLPAYLEWIAAETRSHDDWREHRSNALR